MENETKTCFLHKLSDLNYINIISYKRVLDTCNIHLNPLWGMLACLNNIQKIRPNERNYFERICGIRYFERIFAAAWVV